MAGDIKAIETNYMGCRFRSRLEARWAVFFDALGWDWEYEKQGYTIGYYEDEKFPWLPDFEIVTPNGQHFYVEVKGDPDFFAEGSWLERLDFGGGPPAFTHCGDTDDYSKTSKPLLLLGSIPRFNDDATEFFVPVIVHRKGVHGHWARLTKQGVEIVQPYLWNNIQSGNGILKLQVNAIGSYEADIAVSRAIRTASGARFEHGEKPKGVNHG